MKGLTKRQSEILRYIVNFIDKNDYSPSYRDIQNHFNFASLGTVYNHLKSLKEKGRIDFDKQRRRSILPVGVAHQIKLSEEVMIPLAGIIVANHPIELFSNPQNISIPESMMPSSDNVYALRVSGDGFVDELISGGDILIIEARQVALKGETVVLTSRDNETLIKTIYYQDGFVRLEGKMAYHQPMIVRKEDITVMGVMTGLIRNLIPYQ